MLSRQVVRQAARLSRPAFAVQQPLRARFSTTRSVRAADDAEIEDPGMVQLREYQKQSIY